jgi:hypothetical protein
MADTETVLDLGPDTGPLTVDQAANRQLKALQPPAEETLDEPVPGTDVVSPEGEGDTTVVDENSEAGAQPADDGEGTPTEDTPDAGKAQGDDPVKGTLEAPARWDAKGKALFATLPAEAQEFILSREKLQQGEITKAQQKSAETAKLFETRIKHLESKAQVIGEYVESGQARMDYWSKRMTDWDDWFASDAAAEMAQTDEASYRANVARHRKEIAQANQDSRKLAKAKADKSEAERTTFTAFVEEQARLMTEMIPDFADEKEGAKRKSELSTYLRDQGFEPDDIAGISAKEAKVGWNARKYHDLETRYADTGGIDALIKDAELYRKSVKAVKNPPPPKPKPAGPSAPAGGQGQASSSDEARFKTLNNPNKRLSSDEHVELMGLKRKLGK